MMKIVAAVLLCLPLAFPPNLWCASAEIATPCNEQTGRCVEKSAHVTDAGPATVNPVNVTDTGGPVTVNSVNVTDAAPVNFALYFESMCPYCRNFFKTQLFPAWKTLGSDVINITLVPYGNAYYRQTPNKSGEWQFRCQHGSEECLGNLIDTCAISILQNFTTYFTYIHCMELSVDKPETSGKQCAQDQGIDYAPIEACVNGTMGNALQHEMAVLTDALNPPHRYVPWVTLNDVHTDKIHNAAMRNLLSLVCQTYKGPTPSGCQPKVAVIG